MTPEKANPDKPSQFCNGAGRLKICGLPPSVQTSGSDFEPAESNGEPAIRYALSAIKGVGEPHARALAAINGSAELRVAGEVGHLPKTVFRDLTGFAAKINSRDINKRTLESLAAAGAFDELESNRARVYAGAQTILAFANRHEEEKLAGQCQLFGGENLDAIMLPTTEPWPLAERLRREFESIGFFLSGHPLDAYVAVLARLRVQRWTEFEAAVKEGATAGRLAATVLDQHERRTKSGTKMGILQLSDQSGHYEAILFQEGLNQFREVLEKGM